MKHKYIVALCWTLLYSIGAFSSNPDLHNIAFFLGSVSIVIALLGLMIGAEDIAKGMKFKELSPQWLLHTLDIIAALVSAYVGWYLFAAAYLLQLSIEYCIFEKLKREKTVTPDA